VILAGVLLKIGLYGFARFCLPLFPDAAQTLMPFIAVLAVVGIIYGACVAMVQPDVKKLVAYSSVSHLGFCVLGLFAFNLQGVQGAVIQMVNHGLSTGALFLVVGMLYERRHTRMIADYGGVYKPMPVFGTFFTIIVLSSVALPGLNGFVGEFLILVGAFQTAKVFGVLAASGVVLAAIYLLWMYQRVMHGPIEHEENRALPDLGAREIITLVPIVLLCFWIGLYPKPFLERTEATMSAIVATASQDAGARDTPERLSASVPRIADRPVRAAAGSATNTTDTEIAPGGPAAGAIQPSRSGVAR
jgi:NADH-quinone oxidoreductase subunit M